MEEPAEGLNPAIMRGSAYLWALLKRTAVTTARTAFFLDGLRSLGWSVFTLAGLAAVVAGIAEAAPAWAAYLGATAVLLVSGGRAASELNRETVQAADAAIDAASKDPGKDVHDAIRVLRASALDVAGFTITGETVVMTYASALSEGRDKDIMCRAIASRYAITEPAALELVESLEVAGVVQYSDVPHSEERVTRYAKTLGDAGTFGLFTRWDRVLTLSDLGRRVVRFLRRETVVRRARGARC